jgi:hypothetical protein
LAAAPSSCASAFSARPWAATNEAPKAAEYANNSRRPRRGFSFDEELEDGDMAWLPSAAIQKVMEQEAMEQMEIISPLPLLPTVQQIVIGRKRRPSM